MKNVALCAYGELWLKSEQVRPRFLKTLQTNVEKAICRREGEKKRVVAGRDRMVVYEPTGVTIETLAWTFGIKSVLEAVECKISELEKVVKRVAKKDLGDCESFAVRVKRSGVKGFTSQEMEARLGSLVIKTLENPPRVDLSSPEKTLWVEVRREGCYVGTRKIQGLGGLPVGVSGTLNARIDTEREALASILMMKRGCTIYPEGRSGLAWMVEEYGPLARKPGIAWCTGETEKDLKIDTERVVLRPLLGYSRNERKELHEFYLEKNPFIGKNKTPKKI